MHLFACVFSVPIPDQKLSAGVMSAHILCAHVSIEEVNIMTSELR